MSRGRQQKTVVVGAGPVGSLAALYAARRGDNVEVYELRGDLRNPSTVPLNFTKSINLALSERGINGMRNAKVAGLLDSVLHDTIPMVGRMIHGEKKGNMYQESQPYDVRGRFIRAADRGGLNKNLLNALEAMPNVRFFFQHKLVGADFRKNLAWFERREESGSTTKTEVEVSFDFMIGADGAHSSVRYHLMKFARMDYRQEYIDTLWCEFRIEPGIDGNFRLSPNHLHIWPAGEKKMFIAIPSLDKSFTCTLFLSTAEFQRLDADTESNLVPYFLSNFPGIVSKLIEPAKLISQYKSSPHLPLISIKCTPYHFSGSVVILGDSAHAMVPFYGQGMNAGLEDVRVLYSFLDAHLLPLGYLDASCTLPQPTKDELVEARAKALEEYTEQRRPDAWAINDLALQNYREMARDVRDPAYLVRKWVEERLYAWLPSLGWATQYSRVSFGNERYSVVQAKAVRQKRILTAFFYLVIGGTASWAGLTAWRRRETIFGNGVIRVMKMLRLR